MILKARIGFCTDFSQPTHSTLVLSSESYNTLVSKLFLPASKVDQLLHKMLMEFRFRPSDSSDTPTLRHPTMIAFQLHPVNTSRTNITHMISSTAQFHQTALLFLLSHVTGPSENGSMRCASEAPPAKNICTKPKHPTFSSNPLEIRSNLKQKTTLQAKKIKKRN